jgi:hypothetical protein
MEPPVTRRASRAAPGVLGAHKSTPHTSHPTGRHSGIVEALPIRSRSWNSLPQLRGRVAEACGAAWLSVGAERYTDGRPPREEACSCGTCVTGLDFESAWGPDADRHAKILTIIRCQRVTLRRLVTVKLCSTGGLFSGLVSSNPPP